MGGSDKKKKKPKSFTWQSSLDNYKDEKTGVATETVTENQVLEDGTRIITKTTKLNQMHAHGATTVTSVNTQRIETVEVEERVMGEELTYKDCLLCCCPCLRSCLGEKKTEDEGEGGEEKSKWKPVANEPAPNNDS